MLKKVSYSLTILFFTFTFSNLMSCKKDKPVDDNSSLLFTLDLQSAHTLPSTLEECSGIEISSNGEIWLHNDAGNSPIIESVSATGNANRTIQLSGVSNTDWEDITSDETGQLFIGDFGNNDNDRTNLAIYMLPDPSEITSNTYSPEIIYFSFPDQTQFPPDESQHLFDTEGFFAANGKLYLFIKDRSKPFLGLTKLYELPAEAGTYDATLIGTFNTTDKKSKGAITGADISPDGTTVALLSNDRIWLFTDFTGSNYLSGASQFLDLSYNEQFEGIVFTDNCTISLTCELKNSGDSQLYTFNICK